MDQKVRSAGWFLTALLLMFCAFIFLGIGIGMLASYPDTIWLIGLLLTLCGLVMGITSIRNYRSAKKEQIFAEEQMGTIQSLRNVRNNKVEILVSWFYSDSEWKTFMMWEQKKRGSGTLVETAAIMVIGALMIHFLKGSDWFTALAISISIGLIYGIIKYMTKLSSIKLNDNKMPEVIITNVAIIVNGHMNRFYSNNLWLGKVTVNDAGAFNVLEITYCWNTRSGQSFDEIRVPIPKGSLKEAIFLQERLMNEKKLIEQSH